MRNCPKCSHSKIIFIMGIPARECIKAGANPEKQPCVHFKNKELGEKK
jgi:hypothetical protein